MNNLIQVEGVTYSYNGRSALQGVDFKVDSGEFVAVLGPNGSGKSTLAKLLDGLFIPDQGRVLVNGLDTRNERAVWEVRQLVGLVFQNPDNQLVGTSVEEDVAFGPENLGLQPAEIRRRVDQALASVGMDKFWNFPPDRLSGGQKQKVAVAGALAMAPRCLVLDEATAMLDPQGRSLVLETVHRLHKKNGLAVVLITHFMEEALDADRVVVLNQGRVALQGRPDEVFHQTWQLQQLGLEVPEIMKLTADLKQMQVPVAPGSRDIAGIAAAVAAWLRDRGVPEDVSVWLRGPGVPDDVSAAGRQENGNPKSQTSTACDKMPAAGENSGRIMPAAVENNGGTMPAAGENNGGTMPASGPENCGPATEPLISLTGVSYTYGRGTPWEHRALHEIDLAVAAGDFLGIAGHTGSGKSTLIQHFNGLLRPEAGEVRVLGRDLWQGKDKNGWSVGLVFQLPEQQLFGTTVFEDVAFGPQNLGWPPERVQEAVTKALEAVGLEPERFCQVSPFALSGGEQRRVALAGVLAMEPKVLVLDEPAAGLDPRGRQEILGLLTKWNREQGLTIVMISHNMEELALCAQRMAVLHAGVKVFDGERREVFRHWRELAAIGLDVPAGTKLAHALREQGIPVDTGVLTWPELRQELGRLAGLETV